MASKSYRVRLPTDVIPEKYDLKLVPDVEKFTFEGEVKITVDVVEATDSIHLNTQQLLISTATFVPVEGASLAAAEITSTVNAMRTTFAFGEVLPVGKGTLEIKFRGILNDDMAGFYRSQYTDANGVKKHMATTQFEAISARRCFPCWDEPGVKAVFVVTMVYPAHLKAISNMPSESVETLPDGRKSEKFLPSPKMSTYLLAFCLGEFEVVSETTQGGTLVSCMCCPGNISKCAYALRCGVRCLDFYNEFFGIPYPLPKLDMVAIPDFAAGAMENWGLVTYREVALLCDEATVSATQKHRICTVVTHELAHQWFGNLVTMEWWDDLWLNEGFANWMETFAADHLHPEWAVWEKYVESDQQQGLSLDSLRSSHPIQVPIAKAEEVEEVFDAISYSKGGSVVRMIFAVLGQEKFQEGLKLYFQRHQYGNTETTDLWKAWSDVSGKPVDEMMGSWTSQMGFPYLKVLSDPAADGSGEVEVEQAWFLADGSQVEGDETKTWVVPVFSSSDKGTAPIDFMSQKSQKIKCGDVSGAKWLKLNAGQHVPIRVLYPAATIQNLAANVQSLSALDRMGLLSDTYALCKAGCLEPVNLVELLKGFRGETNDKVWSVLSACLGGLDKIIKQGLEPSTATAFTSFAGGLVSPAFAAVGWDIREGDDDNHKFLRSTLVGLASSFSSKDPVVAAEATKRCQAFIDDSESLPADIRGAVLKIAMKSDGHEERFDRLVEAHNKATDGVVRRDIYGALGEVPSADLRKKFLAWSLTDEVRSQDIIYCPASTARSDLAGANITFDWITENYDQIYARIGESSMMLFQNVVRISGMGFVTEQRAKDVEEFWKSKPLYKQIEKSVSQTAESIRSQAGFVTRIRNSELASADFWTAASA